MWCVVRVCGVVEMKLSLSPSPPPLPSPPSLQPLPSLGQSLPILDLLSDVVSPDNVESAAQLAATADPDATFAQDILNSAEGYGLYLSAVLEQEEDVVDGMAQMTLTADNICKYFNRT